MYIIKYRERKRVEFPELGSMNMRNTSGQRSFEESGPAAISTGMSKRPKSVATATVAPLVTESAGFVLRMKIRATSTIPSTGPAYDSPVTTPVLVLFVLMIALFHAMARHSTRNNNSNVEIY